MTALRRVAVLVLMLVGLVSVSTLMLAGAGQAHTDLVSSHPQPGARLTTSVDRVSLTFATPIVPDLAQVVVRDEAGKSVVSGKPSVLGSQLTVPVSGLGAGGAGRDAVLSYRVAYRAVAVDGHAVVDDYEFAVRPQAGGPAAAEVDDQPTIVSAGSGSPATWALPGAGLAVVIAVAAARVRLAVRPEAR